MYGAIGCFVKLGWRWDEHFPPSLPERLCLTAPRLERVEELVVCTPSTIVFDCVTTSLKMRYARRRELPCAHCAWPHLRTRFIRNGSRPLQYIRGWYCRAHLPRQYLRRLRQTRTPVCASRQGSYPNHARMWAATLTAASRWPTWRRVRRPLGRPPRISPHRRELGDPRGFQDGPRVAREGAKKARKCHLDCPRCPPDCQRGPEMTQKRSNTA